jgi:Peptidase inhibitor family I36
VKKIKVQKIAIASLLTMSLLIGLSVAGTGVAQGQDCPVSLYSGTGYSGQLWCVSSSESYVGNDVNDRVSSAFNATSRMVGLFSEPNYGGFRVCLDPGTGYEDLSVVGLDDDISSISVGSC